MGVTYDAGALVVAQRNDRRMWGLHAVVEGALRRGDAVVTFDRGDLERIAAAAGASLAIEDI